MAHTVGHDPGRAGHRETSRDLVHEHGTRGPVDTLRVWQDLAGHVFGADPARRASASFGPAVRDGRAQEVLPDFREQDGPSSRSLHSNPAQRALRDIGWPECCEPEPLTQAVVLTPPEQGAPGSGEDCACSYRSRNAFTRASLASSTPSCAPQAERTIGDGCWVSGESSV